MHRIAALVTTFVAASLAASPKRGFGEGKTNSAADLKALGALSWHYDWGMTPHLEQTPDAPEFVPMAWGKSAAMTVTAANLTSINATAFLVLNEVNEQKQSNMTPQEACQVWPRLQEAASGANVLLSSPTINNCEPTGNRESCSAGPTEWMDQFIQNCSSASFDFIAYHHYSCDVDGVVSSIKSVSSRYNKPVWLTEFACPGKSMDDNVAFVSSIVPQLDALPDSVLGRYAWFAARISSKAGFVGQGTTLMEASKTTLSHLGSVYTTL
jgi:hypothetical protein